MKLPEYEILIHESTHNSQTRTANPELLLVKALTRFGKESGVENFEWAKVT
jgi:hypothetical protein